MVTGIGNSDVEEIDGACQIFEKAILQTKSFDRTKIRNGIPALDTVTATGRLKVNESACSEGS